MNETMQQQDYTQIIVTLWAIRAARRKVIYEDIFQTPYATHCFINSYLDEIKFLQKPETTSTAHVPAPRPRHWLPPPEGHVQINVDAAVARAGGHGSVAAVCRDQTGSYLGASAMRISYIGDPTTLEALAIREAQALTDDLYEAKIAVASDCKVAVEAIKEGSSSLYGAVIHEIIDRASVFNSCLLI